MLPGHETPPRAGRSGFVAAFLSLLFPGLGHAYLGAYRRGLGFAAPPILIGALVAGIVVRMNQFDLAAMAIQTWFLTGLFIANLVALAYRAAAIVDAWAIARSLGRGTAPAKAALLGGSTILSVAGLAAVLLVMSVAHIAVARYDMLVSGALSCVFGGSGDNCTAPGDSGAPSGSAASPEPTDSVGPAASEPALPPWNGKDRLNILLIGADEQDGGHNTDTMIVVSIDPKSNQVVMFSLPRDTVDVPIPPGPAQQRFGSTFGGKINSWWLTVHRRSDWYPDITVDGHKIANGPGYSGLKAILGNLYGLDIRYFVEVNFRGFKEVVDDLGGVTVDVEVPVLDDNFPLVADHRDRLYIPAGPQHMDGTQALQYARSRHGSSDFDRGARQQRLLVALRRQANVEALLPKVNELLGDLSQNVRTDIPRELVPQLMDLASRIDPTGIRSVIFTPPFYQTEDANSSRGYIIIPNIARIRAAVKEAFTVDPNFQEAHDAIASEGATVWVLNGSGRFGEAASLASYLDYLGIAATAPSQRPDTTGLTGTTIRVYNGAEDRLPLTVKALEDVFGVTIVPVTDPAIHVDIIIITGRSTPELTPPPIP
jgi:LCP family protein required for cell wall assembly